MARNWAPPGIMDKIHNLYGWFGPVERGLWYWFLADLYTGFAARWTSLAYAAQGCIPNPLGSNWNERLAGPFILAEGQEAIIPYHWTGTGNVPACAGHLVSRGWYYNYHFWVQAKPVFGEGSASFDLFLREQTFNSYDFDAQTYRPSIWGGDTKGHYSINRHTSETAPQTHFIPMIKANQHLLVYAGGANGSCSPLPILDFYLRPLDCFKKDPWEAVSPTS